MAQENMILRNFYTKLDDQGRVIPKSPEAKQYLLLLYFNYFTTDQINKTFEIIQGRSSVIEYLLTTIDDIDLSKSMILVEGLPIEKYQPLMRFIQYCLDNGFVTETEERAIFEEALAEYAVEESEEEAEPKSEAINSNLYDENREFGEV